MLALVLWTIFAAQLIAPVSRNPLSIREFLAEESISFSYSKMKAITAFLRDTLIMVILSGMVTL